MPTLVSIVNTCGGVPLSHLETLVRQLTGLSDHVVLFFDERTPPDFRSEAERLTTDCRTLSHRNAPHEFVGEMLTQCPGDFILRLNDDELLSANWTRAFIRAAISEPDVNSYWIARRWLIDTDGSYISSPPHYPDYQLRLTRNDPALVLPPRFLHESVTVKGDCGWISAHAILHYDLVLRDRLQREAKVKRYAAIRPENSGAAHYLYEDRPYTVAPAAEGGEFAAEIRLLDQPQTMICGREYWLRIVVNNRSARVLNSHTQPPIGLAYHWFTADTRRENGTIWNGQRTMIRLPMGLSHCAVRVIAPTVPGEFKLQIDLVEEGAAWFSRKAGSAADFPLYNVRICSDDRTL